MRAVVFNSLLILMPVVGFQILRSAYAEQTFGDKPSLDAIDQTRRNIDKAFADLAPDKSDDRYEFWHDLVLRELDAGDLTAARGFLIAGPELLDRDAAKELRAAAKAEKLAAEDDRLEASALRKLPVEIGLRYETAQKVARGEVTPATDPVAVTLIPGAETPDGPAPPASEGVPPAAPETPPASADPSEPVLIEMARPESESRFAMLGTYSDLVNRSQRWIDGDQIDLMDMKIAGLGLVAAETATEANDARIRAASILRSARRSRRLTPEFTDYMLGQLNAALPDAALRPRVEAALDGLTTTDVRIDRIKAAYAEAIDPEGLHQLELDLAQIDQIGSKTNPAAAISVLAQLKDGPDLKRARLVADAGGDRVIALIKQSGPSALGLADMSVRWTAFVILQIMALTAAALAVFWVVVLSARHNLRRKTPPRVDPH